MNKDEWQNAYDQSRSARALARQLGISASRVLQQLRKHDIEIRDKAQRGRTKREPTAEECAHWAHIYEEAGSVSELARRLGKNDSTVRFHLKKHGIEINSTGFKSPKTVRHYGPNNASWGGGTYYHSGGYVYEYAPGHPDAVKAKGYVLQHRLVMEAKLGRLLEPGELVHHINEVKDDNRPENLELFDRSTHMKHHKAGATRDVHGRFLE